MLVTPTNAFVHAPNFVTYTLNIVKVTASSRCLGVERMGPLSSQNPWVPSKFSSNFL